MSEIAERYERVASRFTDRARSVPTGAWDRPAPCEGWVARDVVRHLVEWFPAFLSASGGPSLPAGPPVDDDPAAAWVTMSDGIQSLIGRPGRVGQGDPSPPGRAATAWRMPLRRSSSETS